MRVKRAAKVWLAESLKDRLRPLCWSWLDVEQELSPPEESGLPQPEEILRSKILFVSMHKAPSWLRHAVEKGVFPPRLAGSTQHFGVGSVAAGPWFLQPREIVLGDAIEASHGDGRAADRLADLCGLVERLQGRGLNVDRIGNVLAMAKGEAARKARTARDTAEFYSSRASHRAATRDLAVRLRRYLNSEAADYVFPIGRARLTEALTELERLLEANKPAPWETKPRGRPAKGQRHKRLWVESELSALNVGKETARDLLIACGVTTLRAAKSPKRPNPPQKMR